MAFVGRLQSAPFVLLIALVLMALSFSDSVLSPDGSTMEPAATEEIQFSEPIIAETIVRDNPWVEVHADVSEAASVTVYERTGNYYINTFDLATLMGPGGSFSTGANEEYTVSSDGYVLTIHCYRPYMDEGGNNIVGTRLNGVPGAGIEIWATEIVGYTLGVGGIPETRFNALGNHMLNHTRLGDEHSEIILGHSYIYEVFPPSNLTTRVQGSDIVLDWTPSPSFGIDYYRIYGGSTPRSIDLLNPIGFTQPGSSSLTFTHISGAFRQEYYYVVRAYNATHGLESYTSNTAGIFTIEFEEGRNAFSLPLQPFLQMSTSDLLDQISGSLALYWMDSSDHWVAYKGPGSPNAIAEVGKGYMVELQQATRFVFTGLPGSMIRFKDGFGFDSASRASLDAIFGNNRVLLTWTKPSRPVALYKIVRSDTRDGFFAIGEYQEIGTISGSSSAYFADLDPFSLSDSSFYIIVPVDSSGLNGSSSFSIAAIRMEFDPGVTSFGIPVKTSEIHSAASLSTSFDPVVGIAYFTKGVWKFHAKEMPMGVYDATIVHGGGFQLSVDAGGPVRIEFIGT